MTANKKIKLTYKSVTFFALQKIAPLLYPAYFGVSFSVRFQKVIFRVRCKNPGHSLGFSVTECRGIKSWSPGCPKGKIELFVLLNVRHHSQTSEKGGGCRRVCIEFKVESNSNISGAWSPIERFRKSERSGFGEGSGKPSGIRVLLEAAPSIL